MNDPQQNELSAAAESTDSDGGRSEFDLAKHGILLMKSGRLVVLLFLFVAALVLFLKEALSAAIFVGAAGILILLTQIVAERWLAARLQISTRTLRLLEFQMFLPSKRTNALYLSPILRVFPLVLAVLSAVLFAILPNSVSDFPFSLISCLCAAFVSGVSIAAPIAAYTVWESLRKKDIAANDVLSMARLARVRTLLADQSLFYGSRSAELRGFYANGSLHPITDLNFDEYLALVLGFCHCDDGSLASAFGFRQSMMDVVLRGMRTTQMEHRELLTMPSAVFTPYDAEIGYVCADLTFADGRRIAYRTGKPEVLLPQVTQILDQNVPRPAEANDAKRLAMVLQNIYEIGRQAIALTQVNADDTLTFLGYLFVTSAPVAGAENAVATLRKSGVNILYVSREQESCAFYRASSLGITTDASRILTGNRIENFRPESLERAIPRARIAAEMQSPQRSALVAALKDREGTIASASEDCTDGLFVGADITISVPSDRATADYTVKHCKITDVAEIFRTVRCACDAAVRAMTFAVSVPFAVTLFTLLTAFSTVIPPFSVSIAVLLSTFLPLPFALIIAARSAQIPSAPKPMLGLSDKPVRKSVRSRPVGRLFHAWQFATTAFSALFAVKLFADLSPIDVSGIPAATAAALLTLLVSTILNAAIAYAWGHSLFSLMERKNRLIFGLGLVCFVAAFALLRLDTVNTFFGLEAVSFRHLPQTVVPAILIALLYEFGLLFARAITRRR